MVEIHKENHRSHNSDKFPRLVAFIYRISDITCKATDKTGTADAVYYSERNAFATVTCKRSMPSPAEALADSSAIVTEANEESSDIGYKRLGSTIPDIIPYSAKALSLDSPLARRPMGISICSVVVNAERTRELIAIGTVIFKNRFLR